MLTMATFHNKNTPGDTGRGCRPRFRGGGGRDWQDAMRHPPMPLARALGTQDRIPDRLLIESMGIDPCSGLETVAECLCVSKRPARPSVRRRHRPTGTTPIPPRCVDARHLYARPARSGTRLGKRGAEPRMEWASERIPSTGVACSPHLTWGWIGGGGGGGGRPSPGPPPR